MFRDCGWEYIQDYAGYSYFSKPRSEMNGDEEIFCDDASRLEMMKRVYKGRLLPLIWLFSACLVPQFILNLMVWHNYGIAAFMGAIIGLYLGAFGVFAVQYAKFKKKAKF